MAFDEAFGVVEDRTAAQDAEVTVEEDLVGPNLGQGARQVHPDPVHLARAAAAGDLETVKNMYHS